MREFSNSFCFVYTEECICRSYFPLDIQTQVVLFLLSDGVFVIVNRKTIS